MTEKSELKNQKRIKNYKKKWFSFFLQKLIGSVFDSKIENQTKPN